MVCFLCGGTFELLAFGFFVLLATDSFITGRIYEGHRNIHKYRARGRAGKHFPWNFTFPIKSSTNSFLEIYTHIYTHTYTNPWCNFLLLIVLHTRRTLLLLLRWWWWWWWRRWRLGRLLLMMVLLLLLLLLLLLHWWWWWWRCWFSNTMTLPLHDDDDDDSAIRTNRESVPFALLLLLMVLWWVSDEWALILMVTLFGPSMRNRWPRGRGRRRGGEFPQVFLPLALQSSWSGEI